MAGFVPPVVVKVNADISEFLAKMEAVQAKMDELQAKQAESASKMGGGGPGGGSPMAMEDHIRNVRQESDTLEARMKGATGVERMGGDMERASTQAESLTRHFTGMRSLLGGSFQQVMNNTGALFKDLSAAMNQVTNGLGMFGSGIQSAFSSITGAFTGPLGALTSLVGFGMKWAVMAPTLLAAPALLGAIGGAAGGLAGSFTVLGTAVGLFAMGAMKAMSYVTGVNNMAQFDALSAPLQRLYYAYHNLSNEITIFSQTMGQQTVVSVLINMFNTFAVVVQRLGPLMGESAAAVQAGFNVISAGLLGSGFQNFINWVGQEAQPVMVTFAQTLVNFASGWTGLMEDLTPAITLFDNGMVSLTATFANWANSPKGKSQVEGFVSYIQKAWPDISKFWGGLGHIFTQFFSAAAKGAPSMAADLGGLFTTIGNAIPGLVKFADDVLPGIVKGFASFTSGFGSGFSQGMKGFFEGLTGKNAPNWAQMGTDTGKFTAGMAKVAVQAAKVATTLAGIAGWVVNKIPGGIGTIVAAWLVFQGLVTAGAIVSAIGGIVTAVGAVGGLAVIFNPVGLAVAAIVIAIVLVVTHLKLLGQVARNVANFFHTAVDDIVSFFEKLPGRILAIVRRIPGEVGNLLHGIPVIGGLISAGGAIGGDISGLLHGGASPYRPGEPGGRTYGGPALRNAYGAGGRGSGTGQINVQTHNYVNVSGPIGPEALAQLEMLFQQHDAALVNVLRQVRPAH